MGYEPLATEIGIVLVVDDDLAVRTVVARILESIGIRSETAANGHEALERCEVLGSDLGCALLDLSMPGMDGSETFLLLRRLNPAIPVVVISGHSLEEIQMQLWGERPPAFLQKPFLREELLEKLAEAVELSRSAGE